MTLTEAQIKQVIYEELQQLIKEEILNEFKFSDLKKFIPFKKRDIHSEPTKIGKAEDFEQASDSDAEETPEQTRRRKRIAKAAGLTALGLGAISPFVGGHKEAPAEPAAIQAAAPEAPTHRPRPHEQAPEKHKTVSKKALPGTRSTSKNEELGAFKRIFDGSNPIIKNSLNRKKLEAVIAKDKSRGGMAIVTKIINRSLKDTARKISSRTLAMPESSKERYEAIAKDFANNIKGYYDSGVIEGIKFKEIDLKTGLTEIDKSSGAQARRALQDLMDPSNIVNNHNIFNLRDMAK